MKPLEGLLIVDKPEGPTSHDIVDRVRRLARMRRVGHTGTLDPMATGMLLVCLGRATRLARFLQASRKEYRGTIRLGSSTDTYDREGAITMQGDASSLSAEDIATAVGRFQGTFEQTPPLYSARKVGGRPSHRLAREGRPVTPKPSTVTVYRLEITEVALPRVHFEATTSAGTYVRSIAHDLGQVLGCGGHLEALRRVAVGGLRQEEAHTLDDLAEAAEASRLEDLVIPLREIDLGIPTVTVTKEGLMAMRTGRSLSSGEIATGLPPAAASAGGVRVTSQEGDLLGIAVPSISGKRGEILRPDVVLVA